MALPILSKTWQWSVNRLTSNAYSASVGANAPSHVAWTIKEALTSMPLNPWVVAGSSDAVTGGMDGVDRWTDYTKIKGYTGAHSWIVLTQPGWNGGAQILFDFALETANYQRQAIRMLSPGGLFTGGSNTAAPTAADSILLGSGYWMPRSATNWWTHVWQSTDGACTRIAVCANNQVQIWIMFETLTDVEPTTTCPILAWWPNISDNLTNWNADIGRLVKAANGRFSPDGTPEHAASTYFAAHGYSANTAMEHCNMRNSYTNEWHMWPMHVMCEATGTRGWFGRLMDIYVGPPLSMPPGLTMPDDGSFKWVSVGDLWLPWDSVNKPVLNSL